LAFSTVIRKSLTPLIYANLAAVVIAGGWLAAQGYVSHIWPAVIALIFSPLILPLYLFPAAFFAGMMQVVSLAYPRVSKFMALASTLYMVTAFALYCMGPIYLMYSLRCIESFAAFFFGVSAGGAPFAILAAKDRDNLFFTGLVWMATICSVVVMTLVLVFISIAPWQNFWIFWGLMAAMVGAQALYEKIFMKKPDTAVTPAP
jgi:hypothetical protein